MSEKDLSAVFPYQEQTEEAIRQRMLSAVDPSWDQSEGSFIWDSLSPAAIEFALAYIRAKEVLQWGFATSTFGPYLDARGAERGIFRRPAQKAVGEVTVEGEPGVYIPEGAMFATEADEMSDENLQYFVTTADGTIPAGRTLTLRVECSAVGSSGNVLPGKITIAVSKISGLTKIDNAKALAGGVEEETDEAFLERYLKHVRNPGASGNIADYIRWAQEADATVGKVQVRPVQDRPGHVQVLIVDLEDRPASSELLEKVQAYIDPESAGSGAGMAPIGAKIHIETPGQLVLSLRLRLTAIRGYDEAAVKRAVVQSISKYLRTLVLNPEDRFVRFSKVGQAIMMTEGVQDFDQLTMAVDGVPVTQNLEIAADAMVVLSEANVEWLQAGE